MNDTLRRLLTRKYGTAPDAGYTAGNQDFSNDVCAVMEDLERAEQRIADLERERDEARKALRLLADEVDVGRRDCQCGDLNCQHVAMTDGLLAAIYECCIAARAAAKERADDGFSDEGTRSRNRNCDDWIAPRGSHGR